MALHTTIHLHNVPAGREADMAAWFDGPHRKAIGSLRSMVSAERFEVTPEQIMPDIPQPWRYLSLYEYDLPDPEIDLPALGPLLAEARDAGLIDTADNSERIWSYAMYADWAWSPNHAPGKPLSGVSIILANFVPGREAEYHDWYDRIHAPEVTAVPGKVGMKRGRLSAIQIAPRYHCPGSDLVLCAQQTDDLAFTIRDFSARARGVSPSGIAFQPRSSSGSVARTVHYFRKVSGTCFWPGGIAYAGDLSAYSGR
ncbi:MAG: hypothetical protein KGZ61_11225 [Sandarakinorhabdus sp.]|nr:hypothetical protein [Sandarakinorhabdus sp.]